MREALLRLHKCHKDVGEAFDHLRQTTVDYADSLSDVARKGGGSLSTSARGALGALVKAKMTHENLATAFGDAHDSAGKALATLTAATGVSLVNRNSNTSSPGTVTEDLSLKADSVTDDVIARCIKESSRQGIVDPNLLLQKLANSTKSTAPLIKVLKHAVGRQNPNAENPMWTKPPKF
jgi:hypothetical protein